MNEGLISRRYARAMFRYAKERGVEELVYEKMKLFEENYVEHPDLQRALLNPVLSAKNKELLLSTAIGIEPGEAYIRGIRLLIRNHREMYMKSIALMYQKMYREAMGIIRVKITTAKPQPEAVLAKIRQMVDKQAKGQVEFMYDTDPDIIGGFILNVGTRQLDASVRKELKEIRTRLSVN